MTAGIYRCVSCSIKWHMRCGRCPRCGGVVIPSAVGGGGVVVEEGKQGAHT
jgi:hypothetical protein